MEADIVVEVGVVVVGVLVVVEVVDDVSSGLVGLVISHGGDRNDVVVVVVADVMVALPDSLASKLFKIRELNRCLIECYSKILN